MWSEIKRKLFHMVGLIYVIGLIYIPRTLYIWVLTIAVMLIFLIEQLRLKKPAVQMWFDRIASGLFREKERHKMSGVFWMLEGVWLTVLLQPAIPLAVAALLYLLLGDSVASLVGRRFHGPKWPGSSKGLIGSTACFLMCLFIGVALLRPHYYEWPGIIVTATVVTLVEGLSLRVDDNFTIPVAASLSFLVMYR